MSRSISLAVVGATGLVGEAFLALLEVSDIKVSELKVVASTESAGKRVKAGDRMLKVEALETFDFSCVEVALFVVPPAVSAQHSRRAVEQGCLTLDLSGVWLADSSVPVWCAGAQSVDVEALHESRLLSVMTGAPAVVAEFVSALVEFQPGLLSATILMPASAAGRAAVEDLAKQTARLLGSQDPAPDVFPVQSAFAVLSAGVSGLGSGSLAPAQTMLVALSRINGLAGLAATAQASWVPAFFGTSLALTLHCETAVPVDVAAQLLENAGMPTLGVEQAREAVSLTGDLPEQRTKVGNLMVNGAASNQLSCWIGFDNVQYGAALKGIQILQFLIKDYL